MHNRWAEEDAVGLSELDLLVYQSRTIGADSGLVVWGGGNTSLKVIELDFRGRDATTLRIKASGVDMKVSQLQDFPGLKLDDVLATFERESMSDEEMVDYLSKCMSDPSGPRPSIETLLHAFLPYKSVVHSHADAVVALTNNADPQKVLGAVYGDRVTIVEYIRPGFNLSKKVASAARSNPQTVGAVLVNHGLVTWADSPQDAYTTHIDLVTQAEEYSKAQAKASRVFGGMVHKQLSPDRQRHIAAAIAPTLRGLVGQNRRMVLRYDDSDDVMEFVCSQQGKELSSIGPATPDHLIQTKQKPLWVDVTDPENIPTLLQGLRNGVEQFVAEYTKGYQQHVADGQPMLDPHPRVVLLPGIGMWTTGSESRAARVTGDIYHHAISVIAAAQSVSTYASLTSKDAFDAEYWPLELYKLTLAPPEKELARQVALVTGGAHGIGGGIVLKLAAEGAHVVVADIDIAGAEALAEGLNRDLGEGIATAVPMNVASESDVVAAFNHVRLTYGGLDILVSNAGIAPVGAIDELPLADWQRAFDINTTGHFLVAREAVKLMKEQALGGSLVFIGTKNVPSPGKDFGAYSASKAAEVQLARVLAIENGEYGIRSNIVNPDAIFEGSSLWSEQVREQRAQAHGISVDALEDFYRQRNLLQERITAADVAEVVLFLASKRSAKTTGAMIPVDGGLRDAFPR